jgi:hypothetical protein
MALLSERRFINISNVTSGMIVQFSYTKLSGENSQYVVLVVDPYRKNDRATEFQLHGYTVDEMSDEDLLSFATTFKTRLNIDYEERRAALVSDLNTQEAYETFRSSKFSQGRPYRTFNISKITQLRQVLIGSPD